MTAVSGRKGIRASADHPLDIFVDPSKSTSYIMLICASRPRYVEPSKAISVLSNPRSDGQWALVIELLDDRFKELFRSFCKDVVESSKNITDPSYGAEFVIGRFIEWKHMFEKPTGRLSKILIQGLIGEVLFLRDILVPKYGEEVALLSWMNAKRGKQDFVCPDKWYEIKTIKTGRHTVTISSLDQLDRDDSGELAVITLNETSIQSPNGINLNSLYDEMYGSFSSEYLKGIFSEMMSVSGYEKDQIYDDYIFELLGIDEYQVSSDFPRITRGRLKTTAIADASYEILIDQLVQFRM